MSIKSKSIIIALLCIVFLPNLLWGQNTPKFLVLTKVHLNQKAEFTVEQWKAHEKESERQSSTHCITLPCIS